MSSECNFRTLIPYWCCCLLILTCSHYYLPVIDKICSLSELLVYYSIGFFSCILYIEYIDKIIKNYVGELLWKIFKINIYPISNAYKLNFQYKQIYECPICFNTFNISEKQLILYCGHRYHTLCLKRWENEKYCCPLCKFNYTDKTKW